MRPCRIAWKCPAARHFHPVDGRPQSARAFESFTKSFRFYSFTPLRVRHEDCPDFPRESPSSASKPDILPEASVKKIDRMREKVTILPTSMYLSKMHDAGWSLVALEWEREVEVSGEPEVREAPLASEEIPFGLRISSDCRHLEDDPLEVQTLKFVAEMIVQDISFK